MNKIGKVLLCINLVVFAMMSFVPAMEHKKRKGDVVDVLNEIPMELWEIIILFVPAPEDEEAYDDNFCVTKVFENLSLIHPGFHRAITKNLAPRYHFDLLKERQIKQIEPLALNFLFLCFDKPRDILDDAETFDDVDVGCLIKVRYVLLALEDGHDAIRHIDGVIDRCIKGEQEGFKKGNRDVIVARAECLISLLIAAVQCGDLKTTQKIIKAIKDDNPRRMYSTRDRKAFVKLVADGCEKLDRICLQSLPCLYEVLFGVWPIVRLYLRSYSVKKGLAKIMISYTALATRNRNGACSRMKPLFYTRNLGLRFQVDAKTKKAMLEIIEKYRGKRSSVYLWAKKRLGVVSELEASLRQPVPMMPPPLPSQPPQANRRQPVLPLPPLLRQALQFNGGQPMFFPVTHLPPGTTVFPVMLFPSVTPPPPGNPQGNQPSIPFLGVAHLPVRLNFDPNDGNP